MRSDPKIEIDVMWERKEYTSDLTDAEWAIIEPLLPEDKAVGRLREVDLREVSTHAKLFIYSFSC